MLLEELQSRAFETRISLAKDAFYRLERIVGHALFRKPPPNIGAPCLLNLGAGPLCYDGWINADDYAFKRAFRERDFAPNWRLDITRPWKCPDDFFDGVFTQHVIEHVPYSDAVFVLGECLRTMKPGAWLRVSVPDVRKFITYYTTGDGDPSVFTFPHRTVALSFLTQMHFHKSTWDADLMCSVLREIGFIDVEEVEFGTGSDERIIRDQGIKAAESLYVEAKKP